MQGGEQARVLAVLRAHEEDVRSRRHACGRPRRRAPARRTSRSRHTRPGRRRSLAGRRRTGSTIAGRGSRSGRSTSGRRPTASASRRRRRWRARLRSRCHRPRHRCRRRPAAEPACSRRCHRAAAPCRACRARRRRRCRCPGPSRTSTASGCGSLRAVPAPDSACLRWPAGGRLEREIPAWPGTGSCPRRRTRRRQVRREWRPCRRRGARCGRSLCNTRGQRRTPSPRGAPCPSPSRRGGPSGPSRRRSPRCAQPVLSVGHLGLARRVPGSPTVHRSGSGGRASSPARKSPHSRPSAPAALRRDSSRSKLTAVVPGRGLPCGCARSMRAATSDPRNSTRARPGERMWPRRQTAPPRQPRRIRLAPLIPAGPMIV